MKGSPFNTKYYHGFRLSGFKLNYICAFCHNFTRITFQANVLNDPFSLEYLSPKNVTLPKWNKSWPHSSEFIVNLLNGGNERSLLHTVHSIPTLSKREHQLIVNCDIFQVHIVSFPEHSDINDRRVNKISSIKSSIV